MEHYFSEKQASAFKPELINIKLKTDEFKLYSASGVFSKDSLDTASKLLIETANVPLKGKILDLGCGYGVIGISFLRKNKDLTINFSDINTRALKLTSMNLKLLGLKGKIIKSDIFSKIEEKYDCIISNPPYAAGRDTCFEFITQSFNHLNPKGTLQIVARHNKGGKILKDKMLETFSNVIDVSKSSGFRVYMSKK